MVKLERATGAFYVPTPGGKRVSLMAAPSTVRVDLDKPSAEPAMVLVVHASSTRV